MNSSFFLIIFLLAVLPKNSPAKAGQKLNYGKLTLGLYLSFYQYLLTELYFAIT